MSDYDVVVYPDADAVAGAASDRLVATLVESRAQDSRAQDSPFHVVLTGGTVGIKTLEQAAANPNARAVDWSTVHFWWGDERFLPEGHPDRNETQARGAFLDEFADAIPPENIHFVPRLDPTAGVDTPEIAAELYEKELAAFSPTGDGVPTFDVLLLGMGPDGHVASLFPNHPGLTAKGWTTGVRESPKPPPLRVSLTFNAIAQAKAVWLVVAGTDKADAVASAWSGAPREVTPAGFVAGTEETLWFVDEGAKPKHTRPGGANDSGE